jgi:hypothetical protein
MTSSKNKNARWERIGLAPDYCEKRINSIKNDLSRWGRYNDIYGPGAVEGWTYESYEGRESDLKTCYGQIQLTHLCEPQQFGDISEIFITASNLAVDLFYGSWRNHVLLAPGKILNRKQCRLEFDWFDNYRTGLLVTLLNRDSQQLEQVADYIGDDLYPDEGLWDRTEQDRLAYSLIRDFTCNEKSDPNTVEKILKGHRKRPKLILETLQAIQDKDAKAFEKPFRELVKSFKKRELILTATVVICIDASILWNMAEMNGLELTTPSDDIMDFVITHQSLGMKEMITKNSLK